MAMIGKYDKRTVLTKGSLIELCGDLASAVVLHQMLYWQDQAGDGTWFAVDHSRWLKTFGLSRYQQRSVRKRLIELNVLEERRGVHAKMHFRIRNSNLASLLKQHYGIEIKEVIADKPEQKFTSSSIRSDRNCRFEQTDFTATDAKNQSLRTDSFSTFHHHHQIKREEEERKKRNTRLSAERSPSLVEGTCITMLEANETIPMNELDAVNETEELLTENEPTVGKRKKASRAFNHRNPDPRLVGNPGVLAKASQEAIQTTKVVEARPISPSNPSLILELLRHEIREKYGEAKVLGVDENLSGKEIGQLKHLLKKHAPEIVIDMIRVLVWDWEIVREKCFPRASTPIPSVQYLIWYRAELAGAITEGFEWSGQRRGATKTYRNRYLQSKTKSEIEIDPFV